MFKSLLCRKTKWLTCILLPWWQTILIKFRSFQILWREFQTGDVFQAIRLVTNSSLKSCLFSTYSYSRFTAVASQQSRVLRMLWTKWLQTTPRMVPSSGSTWDRSPMSMSTDCQCVPDLLIRNVIACDQDQYSPGYLDKYSANVTPHSNVVQNISWSEGSFCHTVSLLMRIKIHFPILISWSSGNHIL